MEINNSDYSILIVDDVDANVLLLKLLISKSGYKTLTAFNGKEALEVIEKFNPDLVLLDIMMPVMDGQEVAKRMRELPGHEETPIIFLSALNSTEDVVQGFRLGAADYVSKPFNKDELLTRINHQISLIAAKRVILRQTEELRRIILGRDKLYSVIAHDLRGPIASIRMVAEVLVNGINREGVGPEMYEMITILNKLTEESFSLLDNLLKWTKSQTGRLNTVFQKDVEIMELVEGVVETQKTVASLKQIRIRIEGTTKRVATLDMDMAKTLLRNLINNALKFSYKGGEVVVEIIEMDKRVKICVKDTGTGISKEIQEKLFKNDTHFRSFGTAHEEGSGLGLLLCRDFAARNGGTLSFASEEGKGSTFCFDIPTPQLQDSDHSI
ncbi:MAG: hybrid sensor histidine kinase/response regulator [Bacteroidales bacterium]|nr:hybrid sensor histidine kinase/response regulator [Bacteroidales bacterium]MDD3989182.1 hybrid sensor histidine kinase/response regulator [Bacteroidales bacterium]